MVCLAEMYSLHLKSDRNVTTTYTLINGFEEVNFIFMFDIVSSSNTTENKKGISYVRSNK